MKTRIKGIKLQNGDATYICEQEISSAGMIIILFALIVTIPMAIKILVKGYWETIRYTKEIVILERRGREVIKPKRTIATFKSCSEAQEFLVQYHEDIRQSLSKEEGEKIKSTQYIKFP